MPATTLKKDDNGYKFKHLLVNAMAIFVEDMSRFRGHWTITFKIDKQSISGHLKREHWTADLAKLDAQQPGLDMLPKHFQAPCGGRIGALMSARAE